MLCDDGNAATCQTRVVSAVNPAPAKKTERVYGMKVNVKWEAIFTESLYLTANSEILRLTF